ncbi:MAG TPA: N-acetylmuramoyl-L-alanine amidase CwlD [Eubacteriaceae bacterium]|nr:N-acetylmuramoyl-L-alanine amidase CwlD [Eubacteriaceae bacterium]
MKIYKNILKVILLFIIILSLANFYYKIYFKVVTTFNYPNFNKVIIIDPGHGGVDPGKVGSQGELEKDLNLKIAQKLAYYIEESGGVAILTRNEDKGLYTEESKKLREKKIEDLRNRRKLIQESNGDILISIHLNSFPSPKYYGAQTFYLEGDKESQVLAENIQKELRNILNRGNHREIKPTDSYYILKENGIPSILVEGGFLSNPEEERLLNDEKYQNKIAWAIYSGIMSYYSFVETISR